MTARARARSNTPKRNIRRALARRDGGACAYCRRPFHDLSAATLDHVVPYGLFRTWARVHLVLACQPCNCAKGNRLSLLVALLVLAAAGPGRVPDPAELRILARLARARRSAGPHHPATAGPPIRTAGSEAVRSTPDQAGHADRDPDRPALDTGCGRGVPPIRSADPSAAYAYEHPRQSIDPVPGPAPTRSADRSDCGRVGSGADRPAGPAPAGSAGSGTSSGTGSGTGPVCGPAGAGVAA